MAFLPIDHKTAVERFIASFKATPLGPSSAAQRAVTNAQVLAFAHALRDPIAALFEPHRFLDQIAWGALGYAKPGDKFRVDAEWLTRPYDNPVSLETMLRGWAAQQSRTWTVMPESEAAQRIIKLDAPALRKEAMFWWDRMKIERAAGREPMPPGAVDTTALSVTQNVTPLPRLSTPVFWGVVLAFVGAGLGAAYLVSRRRR